MIEVYSEQKKKKRKRKVLFLPSQSVAMKSQLPIVPLALFVIWQRTQQPHSPYTSYSEQG